MKPFIKYPGSKRWLTDLLAPHIHRLLAGRGCYYEPFFGSGAMFFSVQPTRAVLGDLNPHLINLYKCMDNPWMLDLARAMLSTYNSEPDKQGKGNYYYACRALYNSLSPGIREGEPLDSRAAGTLLFLLKVCYNGLVRFNKSGKFNVPHGDYKNPQFDLEAITAARELLGGAHIYCGDFERGCARATRGDVLYLDPPYHGVYNGYSGQGFTWDDQIRLHELALSAVSRGVHVYVSLPDTPEMRTLWRSDEFHAYAIPVRRSISCKAGTRGDANELLVFCPEFELPAFDNHDMAF